MAVEKTLVYVCGSGHSGSTLLDMILGGHSQVSALGEAHVLYLNAHRTSKANNCTCGQSVFACPFWMEVAEQLQVLLKVSDSRIFETFLTTDPRYKEMPEDPAGIFHVKEATPQGMRLPSLNQLLMICGSSIFWRLGALVSSDVRLHRTIACNSLLLYEAVRRAWHTPVIVDSTKTPARLKGLYLAGKDRFAVVYLVRDGRATCLSRMKRQQLSMEASAKIWKSEHTKLSMTLRSIPKHLVTTVKYEELCENPHGEASRLCNMLGVEFEERMLDFREQRHNLGGNPMRLRTSEKEIRLDDKWKRELTSSDLATFQAIAGTLNQSLGYVE